MKMKAGQAVDVLKTVDGRPVWVGGYTFKKWVENDCARVQQTSEGPGNGHVTTWKQYQIRATGTAY